jgi:hypothetical protein
MISDRENDFRQGIHFELAPSWESVMIGWFGQRKTMVGRTGSSMDDRAEDGLGRGLVAMALEPRVLLDADLASAVSNELTESDGPSGSEAASGSGDAVDGRGPETGDTNALAAALAEHEPPATEPPTEKARPTEVLFIDSTVTDPAVIAGAVRDGVEVIAIPAGADSLDYMVDSLAGRSGLTAIHLASHGADGTLLLGGETLTLGDLTDRADDWAALGAALAPGGDLLLYGCDIGAGAEGRAYLDRLATLTGADVAASDDSTGAESLGGDWDLEVTSGSVDTAGAFADDIAAYETLLTSIVSGTTVTFNSQSTGDMGSPTATIEGYSFVFDADIYSTYSQNLVIVGAGDGGTNGLVVADYFNTYTQSLTMTHGADPTAEFDLQSVYWAQANTNQGQGLDYVEGYRDGVLVAVYDPTTEIGAHFDTDYDVNGIAYTLTFGADFNNVDSVVFYSTSVGFRSVLDTVVIDPVTAPQVNDLDGDTVDYTEGGSPVKLDTGAAASVVDSDASDFNGATLTVAVDSATADDDLGFSTGGTTVTVSGTVVSVNNTAVGTITSDGQNGANLVIQFNTANATASTVSAVLGAIAYSNSSDTPSGDRTVTVDLTDADGHASNTSTVTVSLIAADDLSTISNLGGDVVNYTEGSGAVLVDQGGDITVTDVDDANFDGLILTYGISNQVSTEHFGFVAAGAVTTTAGMTNGSTVKVDDVAIGTIGQSGQSGNRLTVVLNANATPTAVTTLMRAVTYTNTSETPNGTRTLIAYLSTAGGTITSNIPTVTINLTATNDAPTIATLEGDSLAYTEGDGAQTLDQGAAAVVSDADSSDFDGGTLTVAVTDATANEDLSIDTNGTGVSISGGTVRVGGLAVGTITNDGQNGANLKISFNADATAARVSTLIAAIQYANDSESPSGSRSVTFVVTDGDDGTSSTYTVGVDLTGVNDAPTISDLDGESMTYTEGDGAQTMNVGALLVSDADSSDFDGGTLTVAVTAATANEDLSVDTNGTGVSISGGTVRVGGLAIGTITSDGQDGASLVITFNANATAANVGTLIAAIQYANDNEGLSFGSRSVTFALTDGDDGTSPTYTFTVNLLAVNDPPTIATLDGDTLTYGEGDGAKTLDQGAAAVVSDVDSANFGGGNLKVTVTAATTNEDLSIDTNGTGVTIAGTNISVGGVDIGYIASDGQDGANLQIYFNGYATPAAISTLIAAIQYANDSENPSGSRSVTFVVTDGDGGTSPIYTVGVDLSGVIDAPTIATLDGDTLTYTEGDGAQTLDQGAAAVVTDADSADFDGGTLTVAVTAATANEDLSIDTNGTGVSISGGTVRVGGLAIGTITSDGQNGANLTISFNANATPATISTLIAAIQYANDSENPSGSRSVTFVLTDGDGGTSPIYTVGVDLSGVIDAPTIATLDGDTLTYSEGDGAQTLDQGAAAVVSDADSSDFDGGTLTVAVTAATANEDLSIDTNGTGVSISGGTVRVGGLAIGTITSDGQDGANLTISFNANATPATISTLIAAIQYANDSENPSGSRSVTFVLTDGDGGTSPIHTVGVDLSAVNDAPEVSNLDGDNASTVVAGGGPTAVADMADITVSDVDSSDFLGGTLTIGQTSGTTNGDWGLNGTTVTSGGDATITVGETIRVGGVAIGTVTGDGQNGGDLIITFNANATPALIQSLLRAFTLDAPSGLGTRAFTITLVDGDGTANGGADSTTASFSLDVTPNPPTVANLNGNSASTDSGTPVLVDAGSNATVTDPDSATFDGGSLTITRTTALTGDFSLSGSGSTGVSAGTSAATADGVIAVGESIYVDGVAIGTVSGANDGLGGNALILTLNANATPALIQSLIRGLMYDSTTGGTHAFTLTITDAGSDSATSAPVSFEVVVNTAPVNTLPGAQTGVDGQAGSLSGISVADGDGGTLTTTISVPSGAGVFTASGSASVSGSGTHVITVTGTAAQINATLATLVFTPAVNSSGAQTITVSTTDGTLTDVDTLSITVSDRPTVTNLAGDTTTVAANEVATLDLGANAVVTDGDSATFDGGTLTVARVNGGLSGSFSLDGGSVLSGTDGILSLGETIQVGGVAIGTVIATGAGTNDLVIALNGNATPALVGQFLQGLRYVSSRTGTHAFDVTITDSASGVASTAVRASVRVVAPETSPTRPTTPAPPTTPPVVVSPPNPRPPVTEPSPPPAPEPPVAGPSSAPPSREVESSGDTRGFAIPPRTIGVTTVGSFFQSDSQGQSPLAQTFRAAVAQGGFGGIGGFGSLGGFSAGFQAAVGDLRVMGALTRIDALTGDVMLFQGGTWVQLDTLDALRLGGGPTGGQSAFLGGGEGPEARDEILVARADHPAPRDFVEDLESDGLRRQAELGRLALALASHAPPGAAAV